MATKSRTTHYIVWCYIGGSKQRAYFRNAQSLTLSEDKAHQFPKLSKAEECAKMIGADTWGIDRVITTKERVK